MIDDLCGWTNVDGSQCGLESSHNGMHDFTIPPPDKFYEENDDNVEAD